MQVILVLRITLYSKHSGGTDVHHKPRSIDIAFPQKHISYIELPKCIKLADSVCGPNVELLILVRIMGEGGVWLALVPENTGQKTGMHHCQEVSPSRGSHTHASSSEM